MSNGMAYFDDNGQPAATVAFSTLKALTPLTSDPAATLAALGISDPAVEGMRPGITSCVIKPAATYAEATAQFHSPAASAGA